MKLVFVQMSIILLWFFLDISIGKIIFHPTKDYAISLVVRFFQNPEMFNVKVVNFGYHKANPEEFQILMRSLNDENHYKVTLAVSDYNKTIISSRDRVYLLLVPSNHIRESYLFIDQISVKGLQSIKAIFLFNRDFTKEQFIRFHEQPKAENFDEIIYAFPSFAPPRGSFSYKVL